MMEIHLSDDRKTAEITGVDGEDIHAILHALVAANVVDLFNQCKRAAGVQRYYEASRECGEFANLSLVAVTERIKSMRQRLRGEALMEFVEAGMARHAEVVPIPEGEVESQESFEKWVERDTRKQLALEAAENNGGIPILPTAQQVEDQKTDSPQPFARGMAFTIVTEAISAG